MSVRDGLMAILTLGPAYGLQLHAELARRAPHRGPVNVGQIYSTLDRLSTQRLIASAGVTDDGLPQYALTPAGRIASNDWIETPALHLLPEWTEMLDQVLVGSSVSPAAAPPLIAGYRHWWVDDGLAARSTLAESEVDAAARLSLLARVSRADAAVDWLDQAARVVAADDPFLPYSAVRPKRGRRPAVTAAS
ncbi:PadR family transcriptional regulator [Marisediminicola senii]|uniref:PadR family transcriptional regulator n=1 Tax=Marisediminicola senii TaxID=2711233 RepID=UPI0013EB0521|nr:PadR family transcriptional regulator [Marisediminicola senii]